MEAPPVPQVTPAYVAAHLHFVALLLTVVAGAAVRRRRGEPRLPARLAAEYPWLLVAGLTVAASDWGGLWPARWEPVAHAVVWVVVAIQVAYTARALVSGRGAKASAFPDNVEVPREAP